MLAEILTEYVLKDKLITADEARGQSTTIDETTIDVLNHMIRDAIAADKRRLTIHVPDSKREYVENILREAGYSTFNDQGNVTAFW